jgi:hypothetical protein
MSQRCLQQFLTDSDVMAVIAAAARTVATSGTPVQVLEFDLDDVAVEEEGCFERRHLARERNLGLAVRRSRSPAGSRACRL